MGNSSLCFVAQCLTLCDPTDCSLSGSSVPGNSPGKKTEVGCHVLLPGDLPNPGIKPRSPALQADSLFTSHRRSSRILEWVTYPLSRGNFLSRNQTRVNCIAGRFFTSWAIREFFTAEDITELYRVSRSIWHFWSLSTYCLQQVFLRTHTYPLHIPPPQVMTIKNSSRHCPISCWKQNNPYGESLIRHCISTPQSEN